MDERFTDLKPVSENAAAAIFGAVDRTTKQTVRLCRFKVEGDEREGLKQLFRAIQKLEHRGIEEVVEIEEGAETLDVALVPMAGMPLNQLLGEGPLTVAEFEQVATGLLNAVAAVHDLGLVHGAIRPAVVWIDRSDAEHWVTRVHGFGLGFGDAGDGSRAAVEAYRCAAPEQWEGAGAHRRSDVWAMGCVLYEALSGRPAFDGRSLKELRSKHLKHDVLDLAKLAPQVPKWVSACVMRLMALAPEDRPRKGGVALEIFLKGAEEEVNPTVNAPGAGPGVATGSAPTRSGATSTAVPVPAAAQVMPQWTQSIPAQAPPPPRQPLSATRMIASRPLPPSKPPRPATAGRQVSSAAEMKANAPLPWVAMGIGVVAALVGGLVFFVGSAREDEGRDEARVQSAPSGQAGIVDARAGTEGDGRAVERVLPVVVPVVPALRDPEALRVDPERPAGMASRAIPPGRSAPPAADLLYGYYWADEGVMGYGEGRGVMLPLAGQGAVAEWGDLGPQGGENPLSTFPWSLEQRRIVRRVVQPSAQLPLKAPRSFIEFTSAGEVRAGMMLTGKAAPVERPLMGAGPRTLEFAMVFYSEELKQKQTLATFGAKNTVLEMGLRPDVGGGMSVFVTSRDPRKGRPKDRTGGELVIAGVDVSVPTALIFRWRPQPGQSQLVLVNARGERQEVSDGVILGAHGPLTEFSIGSRGHSSWGPGLDPSDHFRGGIGEVLLYSKVLSAVDQKQLEAQLTRHYFP